MGRGVGRGRDEGNGALEARRTVRKDFQRSVLDPLLPFW